MFHAPLGPCWQGYPIPLDWTSSSVAPEVRGEQLATNFCVDLDERCRKIFGALKVKPQTIDEIVATESTFARRVIERCSQWNEQSARVLWDIDETIGAADRSSKNFRFTFRPCFPTLMRLLQRHFPNLEHGILSGWNPAAIPVAFGQNGHVDIATKFFSPKLLFAAQDRSFLAPEIFRPDLDWRINKNVRDKVAAFREAQNSLAGPPLYLIDNLDVSSYLGDRFVLVSDCEPHEALRFQRRVELGAYHFIIGEPKHWQFTYTPTENTERPKQLTRILHGGQLWTRASLLRTLGEWA